MAQVAPENGEDMVKPPDKKEPQADTQTFKGVPPPKSPTELGKTVPTPEEAAAIADSIERTTKTMLQKPRSAPMSKNGQRTDAELSQEHWELAYQHYRTTGDAKTLAKLMTQAGLKTTQTQARHLIGYGIRRLSLPPLAHKVNHAEVVKATVPTHPAPVDPELDQAIQKRATQEAAAARYTLEQLIKQGQIFAGYVDELTAQLGAGQAKFMVPPTVGPKLLETLAKTMSQHTNALETAIKAVRLTSGQPTEHVAVQTAILLAGCTTEELFEAETRGSLPARLTSRLSGGDNAGGKPSEAPKMPGSARIPEFLDVEFEVDTKKPDESENQGGEDIPHPHRGRVA